MIRHPFAVVASQLQHGGWDYEFSQFEIPHGPFNEAYTDHKTFLSSLQSKEEALTATWCLCNQVPLKHPGNNKDWITINYETLLQNPEDLLARILQRWNMDTTKVATLDFTRLSTTAIQDGPVTASTHIENWKKFFTGAQVERMVRVLDYFEIREYNADPYPKVVYSYDVTD